MKKNNFMTPGTPYIDQSNMKQPIQKSAAAVPRNTVISGDPFAHFPPTQQ